MTLHCPEVARAARPGQFVMLECGPDRSLRRPLSIHRVTGDEITFYFLAWAGRGTAWLAARNPGDSVTLLGPLGNGFSIDAAARRLLLVGGGMGVAPLRFLAETALKDGLAVSAIIGARYDVQFHPTICEDFQRLGADVIACTDDGSLGVKGFVTAILPDHTRAADQVFICGPLGMYRAIARERRKLLGDKPGQVALEVRMGCGIGGCLSCSVGTASGQKRVCKDGPVFDFDEVVWDSISS